MPPPDRFGGDRGIPAPKPYKFVPIAGGRADRETPKGHDDYGKHSLTGRLEGELVALSPIHVASGSIEMTGKRIPLAKAHFRCGGVPTVPGSSLKGAFRSIVEAISQPVSCLRVTQSRLDTLPPNARPCRDKERLCPACRLFGAMGYLGRIQFRDAPQTRGGTDLLEVPSFFPPRSREAAYFERGQIRGRKFYRHGQGRTAPGNVPLEVCRTGSRFVLRVDFENLNRDELGLLLAALGQGDPPLTPKLGGGKPACLGSARVTLASVTLHSASAALDFDAEPLAEDLSARAAHRHMINEHNLRTLADLLKFPGDGPCPDRNY